MKKFVVILAAITALSTTAFADGEDLRELRHKHFAENSKVTIQTAPLAIEVGVLSAYQRMMLTTERDEGGGGSR